jgi:hypothetical protein
LLVKTVCFIWFCSLFCGNELNCGLQLWFSIILVVNDFIIFLCVLQSVRVYPRVNDVRTHGVVKCLNLNTSCSIIEFNGSLSIVEIVNNLKIDFIWSNSYSLHCKESKSGDIRYLYAFKHVVVRQEVDSRFDHFKNKFLSQIKSQYN